MILLDTHALVWFAGDPDRLSQKARDVIEVNIAGGKVLVSSISVWEIAMLVVRGRLRLSMDVKTWLNHCRRLPRLQFVPVDNDIALKSVDLPPPLHKDPADRIIVATSILKQAPLVTGDRRLRDYTQVETLW